MVCYEVYTCVYVCVVRTENNEIHYSKNTLKQTESVKHRSIVDLYQYSFLYVSVFESSMIHDRH